MKTVTCDYEIKSKHFVQETQMVGKRISADVYEQPYEGQNTDHWQYMVLIYKGTRLVNCFYDLEKKAAKDLAHRTVVDHKEGVEYV